MNGSRQLCLEGGLITCVNMIRRNIPNDRILAWLPERHPGYTQSQYLAVLALAHRGVLFAQGIDWANPQALVDPSQAPRLPR